MKCLKLFSLSLVLLFTTNFVMLNAQSIEPKITVAKSIDMSADLVWEQLRVLDNIDELSSLVAKVTWTGERGVGGQRVCTSTDGKGYFKESITQFSDQTRSYTYVVLEGVPAKDMVNQFKVIDLGYNQSMIVWTSSFEFMENPQMNEEQFRAFLSGAVTEMITNVVGLAKKA